MPYPSPKVPLTPPLTSFTLGKITTPFPSLLDLGHRYVSAGRAGITLALRHAGVGPNDQVLVPAYHCESMIAPVEHLGATPIYYRIQADTTVDLADIEAKIGDRTRAILATHYFGFPQRAAELRALCDQRGLVFVEDCAHAFFGSIDDRQIGAFGDYAVGSAMKFFPLFDGGVVASATRDLGSLTLRRPPLALELKGLVSVIEYAMSYQRLRIVSLPLRLAIAAKDFVWGSIKRLKGNTLEERLAPASSQGGYALEPQWINVRMSRVSRFILTHAKIDRICEARRRNYEHICEALRDTPGLRPLFSSLPDKVVPLVVPMIVDQPLEIFPRLKHAGVPIWRFGEYLFPQVTEELCEHTIFLSQHVFQFPCHPELTDQEIGWMIDTIKHHFKAPHT